MDGEPATGDSYDPPQRLRTLPSWLASELARRGARLVAEALAQEGLRRQHFAVLVALAEQGAASQADLGRRLWIDRSDMHAVLADLERDGLVARVRDDRDRRRNVVALTRPGETTLARLEARVESAQEALLAPLSAAERRQLVTLLGRIVAGQRAAAAPR
jgi:MarR family transcriptional regulator, lower aerobic nicotinate degradation pathway regulator